MKSIALAIAKHNNAKMIVESLNEHFPEFDVTLNNMNETLRFIEREMTSDLIAFVDIYNLSTSK